MPGGMVDAQKSWYCVRLLSMRVARPRLCDSRVTTGSSMRLSMRRSTSSESLLPVESKNLMPLSS